jgi:SnoaL-like domain
MSDANSAEALARVWIDRWNEGAPESIPLAEDFTHTSPFGRVQGRETYLEWVKPLAAKNVTRLNVLRTLSNGNHATIHFEMQTPKGPVAVCDWVVVDDGQITAIHSFYDATLLR